MSSQQFDAGKLIDPHTTTLFDAAEGRLISSVNAPAKNYETSFGDPVRANPDGMSLGARRVRVRESSNPGQDSLVDKIKRYTADLIDLCEELKVTPSGGYASGEQVRLVALAQTAYEDAAMWAVKAATTPTPK